MKRYMLKVKHDDNYLRLHTKSHDGPRYPHEYWISFIKVWDWINSQDNELVLRDGYSFVQLNKVDRGIRIVLTDIHPYDDGHVTGTQEQFVIPDARFRGFVGFSDDGAEYSTLNIQEWTPPKIVVKDHKNMQLVASHPVYRRKFAKYISKAFQWRCAAIELYHDFVPYSFYFKEKFADGSTGICGGVILHGQANPAKAYYGTHT